MLTDQRINKEKTLEKETIQSQEMTEMKKIIKELKEQQDTLLLEKQQKKSWWPFGGRK